MEHNNITWVSIMNFIKIQWKPHKYTFSKIYTLVESVETITHSHAQKHTQSHQKHEST